mmetsp:Transcript_11928/g.37950  ORF Transcript_11928/g.37950 Transcript_11928/m.37950 type:complete len:433 (-) Transcript_11928:212-1510(-)
MLVAALVAVLVAGGPRSAATFVHTSGLGAARARRASAAESWFEGPEKTLEVCFTPGVGDRRGCRALDDDALAAILAEARCSILSKTSNEYLDAYVLSESSLFVYPHKVIIKTCGRTTLLRCLRRLLEFATFSNTTRRTLGLRVEWVGYSRKNYAFPDDQESPHTSFREELAYLKAHAHDSELMERTRATAFDGQGYLLGPVTGDHWFVYISDQCERPSLPATERTINVMMFDLPDEVCDHFYLRPHEAPDADAGRAMTRRSGLAAVPLLAAAPRLDAFAFAPCGYSMNALSDLSYATVHVTPQPHCSYASFETNTPQSSYASLVQDVLALFKPRRAVVTLFADANGLTTAADCAATFETLPTFDVPGLGAYHRADFSSLHVEDCVCMMANYALTPRPLPSRAHSTPTPRDRTSPPEPFRSRRSVVEPVLPAR